MIEFPLMVGETPCLALISLDGEVRSVIVQEDRRPLWRTVTPQFLIEVAKLIDQVVSEAIEGGPSGPPFMASTKETDMSDRTNIRDDFRTSVNDPNSDPTMAFLKAVDALEKAGSDRNEACEEVIQWMIEDAPHIEESDYDSFREKALQTV